ncbi:unnamed protein product [Tetraodon nigroviridis]|uniref:(spotted green pufferfish) hypothetical protein n=1 Tax=Tetraodon nigroviridis TaxID=99883 RepID=Q4S4V9_TETNG|nr:unnamed protein product [Tetraodon nigroviridis]
MKRHPKNRRMLKIIAKGRKCHSPITKWSMAAVMMIQAMKASNGEDHTQDVADAVSADKNNAKDDRGRDDHCGTHGSQSTGQVVPVGKKCCQEDMQAQGLRHSQEDWHNNAEEPDKFTPDAPRTHHPASEEDNDQRQSTEDHLQEAQDAMNPLEWPTHGARGIWRVN